MKRAKILLVGLCMSLMVLVMASGANAITITPIDIGDPLAYYDGFSGSGATYYKQWSGIKDKNTGDPEIQAIVEGIMGDSFKEVFKDDTETENPDKLIAGLDYLKGQVVYVLVKDGNNTPSWYLFQFVWDGTLDLQDFWLGNGAISHVSIYAAPVPEPTTLLLLGMGLVGLAGASRRMKK